jgi:hypothetical protein
MATSKEPPVPAQRSETLRRALLEELGRGPLTARDLAARLGLGEKEVAPHLEHLERSLRGKGERLLVVPATCLGCGYVFRDRRALKKPSRCPSCRSERIDAPQFGIERAGEDGDDG